MTKDASLRGACLCGKVRITAQAGASEVHVCHCTMCQKWGGGALFTLASAEPGAFSVEGREYVRLFAASEWAERAFCGECGSGLWYRFVPADRYSFVAGLFKLPSEYTISEEIFTDEQCAWLNVANDSRRLTGAEVLKEVRAAGYFGD